MKKIFDFNTIKNYNLFNFRAIFFSGIKSCEEVVFFNSNKILTHKAFTLSQPIRMF